MPLLSDAEMTAALAALPGWNRENDEIVKVFELESFLAVVAFVGVIAELAEAADHHPDLDIRYRRLRVSLTSHDLGGLSERDVNLATQIEAAVPKPTG